MCTPTGRSELPCPMCTLKARGGRRCPHRATAPVSDIACLATSQPAIWWRVWDARHVAALAFLHARAAAVLAGTSPHWPLGWWHCLRASWSGCLLTSWSLTATWSQLKRSWPSRPLAPWSCRTGWSTSTSSLPQSPELWSSWMTCKHPMPVWWVPGSCASPITMIRSSSIWSECLWQWPQPQDHQPECHLYRPVQETQGHVSGLPHGQAGVPRQQWPPNSRLPWHYDRKGPQLCGDWFQPDNTQKISPA